ncbi:MAG: DMT family transporter [Treponema sp.]
MVSRKIKTNLCGVFAVFFLATSFPFSRIALQQFSPYSLGFLRCAIASVMFVIIGRYKSIRFPRKLYDMVLLFLSGATGYGIYLLLFNKGIQTITSATSSIIIATTPIMTACAAAVLYKEKISKIGIVSIAVSFCGVLIIILWSGVLSVNTGVLWTFAAAILATVYNLVNRTLSRMQYTSVEIITYSMICGALILLPFAGQGVHEMVQADGKHLGALLFLGVVTSGAGFFLLTKGIEIAEKTTDVTNYLFAGPFVATILGYLMLGETLTAGTALGGSLIIVGIILFALKGTAAH